MDLTYLLAFLEGIITFISPCILPMLPIYLSFFAGSAFENFENVELQSSVGTENADTSNQKKSGSSIGRNVAGFVIGFSLVFTMLGVFAGSIGRLLNEYQTVVNVVTGLIVVMFGLHFTGLLRIKLLDKSRSIGFSPRKLGMISSILFGIIFAIGWTPCAGAFLGSALMMAASQGSVLKGAAMLMAYSLGLAIPFALSAIFVDKLKGTVTFIKRHYRIITLISGIFLIAVGIAMIFGWLGYLMALLR